MKGVRIGAEGHHHGDDFAAEARVVQAERLRRRFRDRGGPLRRRLALAALIAGAGDLPGPGRPALAASG